MRITADHAFHIGSQHLRGGMPCQDYAHSGADTEDGVTYAVLADGCSTGGRTDIGARVMTLSTIQNLVGLGRAKTERPDVFDDYCCVSDDFMMSALGIGSDDLLATSAFVAHWDNLSNEIENTEVLARIIGDGVIASRRTNGDLLMERYDWHGNMPLYRRYAEDDYQRFTAAHGGDLDAIRVTRLIHARSANGVEDIREQISLGTALAGFFRSISTNVSPWVAVFSDGVTQVDGMDWRDVVAELMAFKSTEGDFVKRRMNRFLKDCLKHGKGPIDDISMACIHIDHEAA